MNMKDELLLENFIAQADVDREALQSLLHHVWDGDMPEDLTDLAGAVTQAFPELAPQFGTYERCSQSQERKQTIMSLVNIFWLVKDRYEEFAEPQRIDVRITRAPWVELQVFER